MPESPNEERDIWAHPAPQPHDAEFAVYLHDRFCESDTCEGWDRVGSFGKRDWLYAARDVIEKIDKLRSVA